MKKFKLSHIEVRELKENHEVFITQNGNAYCLTLHFPDDGADRAVCHYKRLLKKGNYSLSRPCGISYPCWSFWTLDRSL